MNLRALHYFTTLAELRHFRKAAERCHVSQPTLSTQIKKLEEELGADLLERNAKKLLLTPVGEQVLVHARQILSEAQTIKRIARGADDPFSGPISLGVFPTLAPYFLPHIIPKVRQAFPNLHLQLFEEKTEEVMDMLSAGQVDATLVALPIPGDQWQIEPLFDEPFVVVVPSQHRLAKKKAITASDLSQETLLLLEDGHCFRDQALEVCQLTGAQEDVDFQGSSLETLRYMVAANSGLTLLPILSTKPPIPPTENIVVRPFVEPTPKRTIALVWRQSSLRYELLHSLAQLFRSLDHSLLTP